MDSNDSCQGSVQKQRFSKYGAQDVPCAIKNKHCGFMYLVHSTSVMCILIKNSVLTTTNHFLKYLWVLLQDAVKGG